MRFATLVSTDLRQTRANLAFLGLTVIAPIAFMALFVFLLSGDITSPISANPGPDQSRFVEVLATNSSPSEVPYFKVTPAADTPPTGESPNLVVIGVEPAASDGQISGQITHWFNDVNTNMTKNYRNRVTGAIYAWSAEPLGGAHVNVQEYPIYPQDIAWSTALGVAVFGLGVLFSGLLNGLLSMTQEWENGTMLWLRLAPGRTALVIAAKLVGCLLKSTVAALVLMGALWLFTGALPARPLVLAATLALGYLSAAAVGLAVGFISRNTLTSLLTALVTAVICWVGGGGLGPMFAFGSTAVTLSRFNPATHIIDLVRWSYFGGSFQPGPAFVVLAATAVASVAAALILYRVHLSREEAH